MELITILKKRRSQKNEVETVALLQDLIQQIDDPTLRDRILQETDKLIKQKKFGLVFEEHLPECTPLYDVPIRVGSKVALKTGYVSDIYTVVKIDSDKVLCDRRETHEQKIFKLDEIVVVAEFGEPIYPTLKLIDTVENAPDSDLWHTLIEADNYHALQLLEYLYAEKVDCIYIDPPYNTGAKDWKYNNDYVDSSDAYRHSKWLSMMEKRLKLAKKLLNPEDSVLIVTIDEKEYLHLGCLLEEIFSGETMQMVSITINPSGAKRDNLFSRSDEYAYIILFGNAQVVHPKGNGDEREVRWWYLRRTDYASRRGTVKGGVAQFYPIYVDDKTMKIVAIGEALKPEQSRFDVPAIEGATPVFPVRDDGVEMNWGIKPEEAKLRLDAGYLRAGNYKGKEPQKYVISYLTGGIIKDIDSGKVVVEGKNPDGSVIAYYPTGKDKMPTTNWQKPAHDAQRYGTNILTSIIGGRFSYPKSLYAVKDSIWYFLKEKPNALVLDFFAGSGTTLHAINLLNAEDGGCRRCILVTNNEVSLAEAKALAARGIRPGDEEWNKLGIARYVTWPRTVCSIEGHDINGNPLNGNYGCDIEQYGETEGEVTDPETGKKIRGKVYKKVKLPVYPNLADLKMSDGFKTNAAFFKLSFLDKTSVALGRQFRELLPVLWMKGGAIGKCPALESDGLPEMLILPQNKMAVLIDEIYYSEFDAELSQHPEIQTVFIVTNSEIAYRSMIRAYDGKDCYQLYRDYLDNFRINTGR
ncbi:site-specific DNA-methyltransferase [Butyricicoccus pullicaecorum]|uniref:site-specific DNA-methyltransferase n=1 Tax=Butyricicoccus pullicaecorum TaxID=501571 RepID=UPI0039904E83